MPGNGRPFGGGGSPATCEQLSIEHNPVNSPPGNPNGGGGGPPGFCPSIGFEADCPSAAYELVIESITDCAFSCPISGDCQSEECIYLVMMGIR